MPPKPNPSLYSVSKTFMWFAVASIVLTASLAGIVYIDTAREWKTYQKKFLELKREKVKADLKDADSRVDGARMAELEKEMAAADAALQSHEGEREALAKDAAALESKIARSKAEYQTLKQYSDSYRYFFEENRDLGHEKAAAEYGKKLAEIGPRVAAAKAASDALENERDDKLARAESFAAKKKDVQKQIDKALDEKNRLQARLKSLEPSFPKDVLLNAPVVDFLAPTLRVQQVVLEDLYDDFHFAKVQKVDRCTTCHLGIDQKGFSAEGGPASGGEEVPQPFRAHPKLELYVGSDSPHPVEKFGCTTCHGGNGHSVSFTDTAHTPKNEEQAKEWAKKHGWRTLEKWDAKMLPLRHVEAACAKCHRDTVVVPQATRLNEGRKLAETYGCMNCHKIAGLENRWKVGPSLENVGSKVDRDWIVRWLQDPTHFRASTKMPRVFHLSNTSDPESAARDDAAIEAIAAYLLKHSSQVTLSKPPAKGDAARGETFVKELGCLGCHNLPAARLPDGQGQAGAAGTQIGDFGPELSGLGSKTTAEWLYTWVKDPKHVNPDTRMPNLRLSDEEASDVVAYLLSRRNEEFEKITPPKADPGVVNELVMTSLQSTMRRSEAESTLAKMSAEDRLLFLGKKSIAHQGCYSCHAIRGFEDAKPIGTELSNGGRKDIHQLDFGYVDIDHTREAFISQKLKDPRGYDEGKIKAYYDKLRMPQFHFTEEERQALTTFVLSLTQEQVPLQMQRRLDSKDRAVEEGRLLTHKLNCTGCHALDGVPGDLRELAKGTVSTDDDGDVPPSLEWEGAKTQEPWLHAFLHKPSTIRSWLKVRMPTFNFTDEELDTLVKYFAHRQHEEISYKGYAPPATTPEKLAAGKFLFDEFKCAQCHQVNPQSLPAGQAGATAGTSFLAPEIELTKHRLKPGWTKDWIKDPQSIDPETQMPNFFLDGLSPMPKILGGDVDKQAEAIRDYLYRYEKSGSSAPAKSEADKAA